MRYRFICTGNRFLYIICEKTRYFYVYIFRSIDIGEEEHKKTVCTQTHKNDPEVGGLLRIDTNSNSELVG